MALIWKANIMYLPWESIGIDVSEYTQVYRALEEAGVNFEVDVIPGQYTVDSKQYDAKGYYYIIRSDNKKVLGHCKSRFVPLQNSVMVDIIQPLIDEGLARLDTIGVFNGGEKIWMLVELPDCSFSVIDNDEIVTYLLLVNGHDGTTSVMLGLIPLRVQCSNVFPRIMGRMVRYRHTENIEKMVLFFRNRIVKFIEEIPEYKQNLQILATFICKNPEDYIKEVFKIEGEASTRTQNKINKILRNCSTNTYYDVFNSITNYLSFEAGNTVENRLSSLWIKGNANIAQRALEIGVKACTD